MVSTAGREMQSLKGISKLDDWLRNEGVSRVEPPPFGFSRPHHQLTYNMNTETPSDDRLIAYSMQSHLTAIIHELAGSYLLVVLSFEDH